MRLKLYREAGVMEAMARVRAELGSDAIILSTRRVAEGVEVTAALETPDAIPLAAPPSPRSLAALRYHGVPETLHGALTTGALEPALAGALRFGALDLGPGARPVLVAGPPGAGKTLTIARLATRLVLAGVRPMVFTADGTRAGAAEQLAAYTRLLGVDLIVASNPVTLARALARRADGAPVLIDAAGCNPFDQVELDAITALAAATDAVVAAVLPAGADPAEAAEIAENLARAGASLLIATRLDLARRLGGTIAAAHAGRLALAEAGIGPGAADGLVALTPALLAARLLANPHFGAGP